MPDGPPPPPGRPAAVPRRPAPAGLPLAIPSPMAAAAAAPGAVPRAVKRPREGGGGRGEEAAASVSAAKRVKVEADGAGALLFPSPVVAPTAAAKPPTPLAQPRAVGRRVADGVLRAMFDSPGGSPAEKPMELQLVGGDDLRLPDVVDPMEAAAAVAARSPRRPVFEGLIDVEPRAALVDGILATHPAPTPLGDALRSDLDDAAAEIAAIAAMGGEGGAVAARRAATADDDDDDPLTRVGPAAGDALPEVTRPFIAEEYLKEVVTREVAARLEKWKKEGESKTDTVRKMLAREEAVVSEIVSKRLRLDDRLARQPVLRCTLKRDEVLRMCDGPRRICVVPRHRRRVAGATASTVTPTTTGRSRGRAENGGPNQDVVLTVALHHSSQRHIIASYEVRASQPLSVLLDALPCVLRDHLAAAGQLPERTSGFLYAGGTFYERTAPGAVDYVLSIKQASPAHRLAECCSLEESAWGDLPVRLGDDLLYRHLGRCDHVLRITDARLDTAPARPLPCQVTAAPPQQAPVCEVCKVVAADVMLLRSHTLPDTDAFVCENCLAQLHAPGGYAPPVIPLVHRPAY